MKTTAKVEIKAEKMSMNAKTIVLVCLIVFEFFVASGVKVQVREKKWPRSGLVSPTPTNTGSARDSNHVLCTKTELN